MDAEKQLREKERCDIYGQSTETNVRASFMKVADKFFEDPIGVGISSDLSLAEFLQQKINKSIIDHLWIDNYEKKFELLNEFTASQGTTMFRNDITAVCQINAEFFKDVPETEEKFGPFLAKILQNSDYLPFLTSKNNGNTIHLFLINSHDEACVSKYLARKC